MKKELEKFLEERGWYMSAEKALELAEAVCIFLFEKTEREEPYASRESEALKSAKDTIALALDV